MNIMAALFQSRSRHVGFIVPEVIVSEKHVDTIEVASHPVQSGANISDHAWIKPGEIVMTCGFAGGGSLLDRVDTRVLGASVGLSPEEVYQQLLELQQMCEPFEVVTSKRTYSNMLLKQIDVTTDKQNKHSLMCTLSMVQVLISDTENVSTADKTAMKQGVSTAAVQNGGTKIARPVGDVKIIPLPEPASYSE